MIVRLAASALLLLLPVTASAQSGGAAERIVGSLARCRAAATADARLDCFDKATAALEAAGAARDVTIVDRQDMRRTRRSLFGFTLPSGGLLGEDRGTAVATREEAAEFEELNTTVASARPMANGRVELRLTWEDAVWVTTDPMPFPPKSGAALRIRKGALGNYFITVGSGRAVRGMRLR